MTDDASGSEGTNPWLTPKLWIGVIVGVVAVEAAYRVVGEPASQVVSSVVKVVGIVAYELVETWIAGE